MPVVMGISGKIVVLDFGRKIAEGRAIENQKNPQVIYTYLGDLRGYSVFDLIYFNLFFSKRKT